VAAAPNNGFGLYLKGRLFVLELAGGAVPASGTAWTMRDYSGGIYGGTGAQGGNLGSYQFFPAVRPFTAPGSAIRFAFAVHNEVVATTSDILARVHTVPDPYYVTNAYERSDSAKVIKFVHLPVGATIRIYTASARLVRVLRNSSDALGGTVDWDVRSSSGSIVASGVYFYTVEADGVSRTFRMTIVSYAPRRRD
jgi:hypothetical protein